MPTVSPQQAHSRAVLGYVLYFLGFLFGITALIGVIINHVQKKDTAGSYIYSHIKWQIISFWVLLALSISTAFLWPADSAKWLLGIALIWWTTTLLTGIFYLWRKRPLPVL